MKTIVGDLIQLAKQGRFDVIVHGCNCHCAMGAGIAQAIKTHFPAAYEADLATVPGDRNKLGQLSSATVDTDHRALTIVNAYTQYDYVTSRPQLDYQALQSAFDNIKRRYAGKRIGYPKIGAGLAGGDWDRIARIIDHALEGEDHTLVELAR